MAIDRHSAQWYAALDAHVHARADMPFAWASNDCCTFADDWVQLVRGADPMADLRALYLALAARSGQVGAALYAARALREAGGLLALVVARMGAPLAGTLAQVGDVALVRDGAGRSSMGICLGAHVAAPGVAGLLMVPINQAEAAWRV